MITVCIGTRPELLKIEPLLKHWESIGFEDFRIWLTNQHRELCKQLHENWEFSKYTKGYLINEGENRLDSIVTSILQSSVYMLDRDIRPNDAVLVQGDTATAFACALAAFHRKIPIIHLEAGLRSYDNENPYPEEFYRRSISGMSNINLCPTEHNVKNLYNENALGKCFVVGNTVIDNIKNIKPLFENKILITLHRRENHAEITKWFECIEKLANEFGDYEFILPIHMNPEIYKLKEIFKKVKCVDPLPHNELIDVLRRCKYVITDSGGIAEEATWLGKRIFLCRQKTERPEGEAFYIWSQTPEKLRRNFMEYMAFNFKSNLRVPCPFGDGNASEKITDILLKNNIIKI